MKRIIIFVPTIAMMLALYATDYREVYKGDVYNFISRGEGFRVTARKAETDFSSSSIFPEILLALKTWNFFGIRLMQLYSFDRSGNLAGVCDVANYSTGIVGRRYMYECLLLGKRYSEGWICDLNGNGRQELVFIFGYLDFNSIRIMAFNAGTFREPLRFIEMNTKVLDADVESGHFTLSGKL